MKRFFIILFSLIIIVIGIYFSLDKYHSRAFISGSLIVKCYDVYMFPFPKFIVYVSKYEEKQPLVEYLKDTKFWKQTQEQACEHGLTCFKSTNKPSQLDGLLDDYKYWIKWTDNNPEIGKLLWTSALKDVRNDKDINQDMFDIAKASKSKEDFLNKLKENEIPINIPE